MKLSPRYRRAARLAAAALILCVCLPLGAQTPSSSAAGAGSRLKIGVFLDSDSLPILVADAKGLFAKEGVQVSIVTFQNPIERDAALQAGAVDGVVSDLLAAALAAQSGFPLRITSLTDGRYGIVAAPNSGIGTLRQLAGQPIGVSLNTVIQYATETLLSQAGLAASQMNLVAVPKMPVRLELVMSGQIKAACLPEPLLSAARERGAAVLAASDDTGLGAGVLLFTKSSLDGRLNDIKAFYRAYAAACAMINADNDAFRPFLAERLNFPANLTSSYRFVRYAPPRLPKDGDIAAVIAWLKGKGLLKIDVDPKSLVDARAIAGL